MPLTTIRHQTASLLQASTASPLCWQAGSGGWRAKTPTEPPSDKCERWYGCFQIMILFRMIYHFNTSDSFKDLYMV